MRGAPARVSRRTAGQLYRLRQLALPAPVRALRPKPCAAAVCAAFVAASAPALAQQIVPDGRTATSLAVAGNLTNVTTTTLSGANAFNSFSRFGVDAGNVVNLHVPTAAANLINIVRDERTSVHGILNSIQHGRIGGNVWFANPHGFVVGPTGVVNVGSLTVTTPTQGFVNNFFLAPGTPNEAAVQQLLSGTAPRNATGLIAIQGTVNAAEGIHLLAGTIQVGGTLYSGARFVGSAPDFRDVVNVNGVASAANAVLREGRIVLLAEGDVAVSGTVAAPGGAGVRGGEITVRAGGNVELEAGANLVARGNGERSSGGTVSVWADRDAIFRRGAVIDASAGASGDGGFIELSARGAAELAGGEFRAAAAGGRRGTVLVDPETVTVSADFYSGGANHLVQADRSITVNAGVTLSTRNVIGGAAANQETAGSAGDSGNLALQAPSISLQSGSRLLAHADGGFQPGDITLTAMKTGGELEVFSATDTSISLSGATVKGRNVTFSASSSHTSSLSPVVSKRVRSIVDLDSSNIDATGTLAISASALVNSSTPNFLPFGTVDVDVEAAVSVRGASTLASAGGATLFAGSSVTAKALPGLPDFVNLPGDAGVAVVIVDSKATVDVAGTTTASAAGALGLAASNAVNVEAKTDASASGPTAVGGAVSVAVVDTTTRAAIGGSATVTQAAAINLAAESNNAIVASAKAAAGGAQQRGASSSKTEETLGAYQDQASTADGGVQVAAAVAVSDLEGTTQAYLGSSAPVATSGALSVRSKALNQAEVTADGSSSEGGVGVGVGVALNLAKLANSAYIAQTVNSAGATVEAVMADPNQTNKFITSATSGAAASNVGVAGALALNVIENRTKALLTGAGVANAGSGEVTLLAGNASEASATARPAAGGTTGDKFGLGASVAVHVATNETRAEVEGGGRIEGARDVTLSASGSHGAAVQAEAGAQGGIGLTPVVAVAVVDNTTTARLGSLPTGTLSLSGDLLVSATHSGTTATSAKADTVGEKAAIGAAVAVTIANDAALATTARRVTSTGGGVAFEAHSDSTSSATAKASAKGGKEDTSGGAQNDGVDQEIGKQTALGKNKQAAGSNNAGQQPASAETAGEGGGASKLSVAAAIAVNVADSRAEASVPAGRDVSAGGGELRLSASNNTDASASADGAAVGDAAVGVGAAVAINVAKSANVASLGAGTHSGQGVRLEALMKDTGDTTSSFGAEAKSGGGSSNVGVAGSLGLNIVDHASTARIETGASVAAGTGDVRIEAENRSESSAKALPAEGGASGAKLGIGASVAVNVVANEARAELADGVAFGGGRNLTVAATGEHAVTTEAEAGSEGGISVTPSAAVTVSDNQTIARLGAGGGLNLSGGATVSATHAGTVTTSAKGSSQGAKAAIGMAVAVTVANDSALATTSRDITAGGELTFLARASQRTEASATASAKGGKQEDENTQQDGVDQEVEKQASYGKSKQKAGSANQGQQQGSAQSGEGKVSVAAAVAVNVADSRAQAFIPDGRTVHTSGTLTIQASNNTDAKAAADGSAAGSTATVGIGAAVAVNKVNALTEAYIGAATITANGVAVRAGMTDVGGDTSNAFAAEAKSGAGGGKVGIAGSLALNLVDVAATAEIHGGAAVNAGGGDVEVAAESASGTTARALPDGPASGGQVGVGASVALNLFSRDLARARIRENATLNGAGDLRVAATSDSDTVAQAEAGAAGSIAVDAVVAFTEVKQTTEAIVAAGAAIPATGAVNIRATATGTHEARATGDVRSGKVGVGASAAIVLSDTSTKASLERDLTAVGDLTAAASATRSYEAVAKASAAGGRSSDQLSQQEKDQAKSTSTLQNNQSAQRGTEKTGVSSKVNVAAAAGVLVLDDDVEASVAAGRTLSVGGDLEVAAFNSSDFSARGLGDTLDITKPIAGSQIGIGVGVGLSVVRNDTTATIGAGVHILDAGDIRVAAESKQNVSPGFKNKLAAEGVSGAGSEKVSVAGALAVANSNSRTHASVGDGVVIDQAGAVAIEADNTSKLSAKAWSAATSGKVGVGASIAIVVSENEYRAGLGADADVTAASLTVAARNRKVSGTAPLDFTLDDVKNLDQDTSKITDANLQILLGENNYYTEAIAGGGSSQVAVTGAFSINVFDDTTEAVIGQNATVSATGSVGLAAASDTTAKAFAGGISAAGKVGVGVATADIANTSATRAYLADGASISQSGGVAVDASAALDLTVIGASAAGAGTAGASGVLSLILSESVVEAYAGDGATIRSGGNAMIVAANTFAALNVAGVAGIGGTVGVGVSAGTNAVNNETRAWIGANATVDAAGRTSVDAASSQEVLSVVVGGAGGGTAGVAASTAVNVYSPVTQAWIGTGAKVNADPLVALGNQSVRVSAESATELLSIVGTVGIGGTAGVGGAADVVVIDKTTQAWIAASGPAGRVRAGSNLEVRADSAEEIRSVGAGFSAGGTAGVQGVASIVVLTTDTQSYAAGGARLHSEGNIVIAAASATELDQLAGAGAHGGTAGVGAAAAVAVVGKKTHAWIGDGAEVAALATKAAVPVATGSFGVSYLADTPADGEVSAPGITPSDGQNAVAGGSQALTAKRVAATGTRAIQGLAVTAVSRDDVESFAVTGAASGTGSVTLSGDVNVFGTDTQAWIGDGTRVNESNTGAGASQSVLVAAGGDFYRLGIAGALAASGTVGVGVGADVAVMNHTTKARIGDSARVNARKDVEVAAKSNQEVVSISASLGASGTVGVSGTVSVLTFDNETGASIGDGARVDAGGNVAVTAQDDTDTTMIAGTVALGLGGGGVGGGVGVTVIDKDTRAWVGEAARVDARGQNTSDLSAYSGDSFGGTTAMRGLRVQAQSSEDLFTISAAGAGGLYVGIAGAVSVASVDSDTAAWIGGGAQINTSAGTPNANQDVNVTARNDLKIFNVSGALGAGAVGIAGSVDVGVIRNDTTAFIGDGATVNAARDVDVNALSRKDLDTFVVSASGGLAGIAAGVAVYSVGGALDSDSQNRLKSDDGSDTVGSYADGQSTNDSVTRAFLRGYSDSRIQGAAADVESARGGAAVSGQFTATETRALPAGNAAFIGRNTTINAGRHVDVDARESVSFDMITGALSVGAVGLGAGVGVANFRNDNRAFIDDGASVTAGAAGSVTVTARLVEDFDALGIAGTGGIVAVDAAVSVLNSKSNVVASFGDNVAVRRANRVRVEADDDRTLESETFSASVGAITAGASVASASVTGETRAAIGAGAAIGQVPGQNVNGVELAADANHAASAEATAGKAGLGLAASGTVATATINPSVTASIGANGALTVQNDVEIAAGATVAARAEATGINVALGGSVGASVAEAKVAPRVTASLGANTTVTADNLRVAARQLVPGSAHSAHASATGAAGGLLVGANATSATAENTGQVRALVGEGATLTMTGSATVSAENNTSQLAEVSGVSAGIVALGANFAQASSDTLTHAIVGEDVSASGSVLAVQASGKDVNLAEAVAGSGGVVSGAAASANTTSVSHTLARTGAGTDARRIAVGTLDIRAAHTAQFNGSVDSLNASLVGASGAAAVHNVTSTVAAGIGSGGRVSANNVLVAAENKSHKFWLGAGSAAQDAAVNPDDAPANVNSGSGGLFDLPAGSSKTHITQLTTASVGENAKVHVLMPALGNGLFSLDAYNEVIARDKAKLDSGGAIAVAKAVSHIFVDHALASVVFGANSEVVSDLGDIKAGARSRADIVTRSTADTYGLAGAPAGEAFSVFNGLNQLIVGGGALIRADDGNVFLAAGRGSGDTPNSIHATSNVYLWNKTAIPIATSPDAQSNVVNDASLNVASAARVESGGSISLIAERGPVNASAVGIGKDIYREALAQVLSAISELFGGDEVSFEIHGGSTSVRGAGNVRVDGRLLAGIHRTESLTLDFELLTTDSCSTPPCRTPDGRVAWRLVPTATDGITFTVDPGVGIAANIQKRIDKLRSLAAQYAGDPVAVAAYQSEIAFLEHKLVELGLGQRQADGSINVGQWNNPSPRALRRGEILIVQSELAGFTTTITTAGQTVVTTTTSALGTVTTILGNVDSIVSNHGTVRANNATIKTKIEGLSGFNAGSPPAAYTTLTAKLAENDALHSEIANLRSLNAADQESVTVKNGQINSLLGEVATLNSQLATHVNALALGDNSAANRILSVQTQIAEKQATIGTLSAEVHTLLGTISARHTEINAKSATLSNNTLTIDNLEASLATALRNPSNSNDTTLFNEISTLRANNNAPRTTIGNLSSQNAGHQTTYSGFVGTVATQNTAIASTLGNAAADMSLLSSYVASLPGLSDVPANGPIADFVHVNDITVRLGNINVKADNLIGAGELRAPGDARINITNNTPNFLVLNNLTVLSDEGGMLRLNGVLVNGNSDINRVNRSGSGANFSAVVTRDSQGAPKPAITILSNYDPDGAAYANLPAPAPNIELNGNITNLRGSVTVHSKAGSILSSGQIRAGTVDIRAENGDFVQSFVDNFFHIGGDPGSIHDHGTPLGAGIVANGSVFISARYLNINSLIQSGIEQWSLTLPSDATLLLTGPASLYGISQGALDDALNAYVNGSGPQFTDFTPTGAPLGAFLRYDARSNRIEANIAFANYDRTTAGWGARTAGFNGLYPLVSDYGNIGANFDPVADRFVLDGEAVRGGYIQLFGQILNTSDSGAGRLRVLDGYGQLVVNNPTARPIVLNRLDAGADPTGTGRGTAGRIEIMDVQGINPDNTSSVVRTVFTRDYDVNAGTGVANILRESGVLGADGAFTVTSRSTSTSTANDGRSTSYSPQTGLRFVWTTGTDNSNVRYWQFRGPQVFGFQVSQPAGSVISTSGPYALSSYRIDDGTYLSSGAALGSPHNSGTHFASSSVTRTTSGSIWVKTAEWTDCNWWTLCIVSEYNSRWTETFGSKTITTKSLKADYPIAIEFSGFNRGAVTVNSASSVILNGDIRNNAGITTIHAGGGIAPLPGVSTANRSIIQGNDTALITSRDLTLNATGSIGAALGPDPARSIQTALGGVVNAAAANGNVLLAQTAGDLRYGSITATGTPTAGSGKVVLESDGSIVANSPASLIQGARVELTSHNGAIGSLAAPLAVNVGYVDNLNDRRFYGLKATAAGDIGVAARAWGGNPAGDLLVDTVVSLGGDVKLTAPGRILDNNPFESIETRTWNELLNFWDALGLRRNTPGNAAKQEQAVRAYESGRTQDYRTYWLIRSRQADPTAFDPGFEFVATPTERAVLAAQFRTQEPGLSDAQVEARIAQFERNRTQQYRELHVQVGSFTAAFDETFRYSASQAERDALLKGSSWTERELGISVTPGLLKDITNTNPIVKAPNVAGRSVTLEAGSAIGETRPGVTIPTDILPENLTEAQKVALAAAERSDLVLSDDLITVLVRKPVNFDALTGISATVAALPVAGTDHGSLFLASLGDGLLGTIQAAGETRVKVRGSIVNTGPSSLIRTGNLVLEAANGGIGFIPDQGSGPTLAPLALNLNPGATLIARAADNVSIVEAGDLNVDTVFSRKAVELTAAGSILDAFPNAELNVLADSMTLTAQTGSIGSAANPLEVGVNPTGRIRASATGGIYLHGPFQASFNIGSIAAGDAVRLGADVNMLIDGPVTAPGPIGLVAGGAITMTPNANVRASALGLLLDAATLVMAEGARMTVDVGTIDIRTQGDAVITGIFTGNPTASAITITAGGSVLDGGDSALDIIADTAPGAKLTITAGGTIGGNPLDVRLLNLEAISGGLTHLAEQDSVNVVSVRAGGEVLLNAGVAAPGSITGADITSTGGAVNVAAAGGAVNLVSVSGTGNVSISGDIGVALHSATSAAGDTSVSSSGGNVAVTTAAASGSVTITAGGNLTAGTVSAGGAATLEAAAGNLAVNTVSGDAVNLAALGALAADSVQAGSFLTLSADRISATVQHTGASGFLPANLSNYAGGPATFADLTASSPLGISFGTFSLTDGSLGLPSGDLAIAAAFVGNRVTITNPATTLLIDQNNRSPQPSDIQVWAPRQPFGLTLSRNIMTTDATVVHYNELTHSAISFDPGITPDLRHNVERGLAIAEDAATTPRTSVAPTPPPVVPLVGYRGVPVRLPDCTKAPLPEECK